MFYRSMNGTTYSARRRRGATAVEFGLVAPAVFLFIFGMIETGRALMIQQALTNAARQGCRTASLATTVDEAVVEADVRSYLKSAVPAAYDADKLRVTMNPASFTGNASGTPVSVNVRCNFSDVSWLPGSFLKLLGDPELGSQSTHRRE